MTRNNANNKHLGIGPRIRERSKIRVPNSAEFGRIRDSDFRDDFPNIFSDKIRVPEFGRIGFGRNPKVQPSAVHLSSV